MRRRRRCPLDFEEQVVGVAPPPVFAWLERADQRMVGVVAPVSGRVTVGGAVTTADMTAVHAQAEVHPAAAASEAVLAAVARREHIGYAAEVGARVSHRCRRQPSPEKSIWPVVSAALNPPSATRSCPLTYEAASLPRKASGIAASRGVM